MVATVFDSARPLHVLAAAALGGCVASVVLGFLGWPGAFTLFLGSLAALLVWDVRPRRRPRKALIECRAGMVRGRGIGTVRARDLVGATTATHAGRVSLMLAHRRRKHSPIILDLPDEVALRAVSKSLGIGYHGFGEVGAVLQAPPVETWSHAFDLLALAFILAAVVFGSGYGGQYTALTGELFGMMAALAVFGSVVMLAVRWASIAPRVALMPTGLFLPQRYLGQNIVAGGSFIPFGAITRIDEAGGRLDVVVEAEGLPSATLLVPALPSRWMRKGLSRGEIAHVASQIRAASERAHGNYIVKQEPEASAAQLRRASGEGLREWVARIDALSLPAAGYRGAHVSAADLWSMLEDPEAHPDVRGASARLLVRIAPEDARTRVADVLAAVRDERVRARITASLDADALEEQEQEEARAARKPGAA